MTDIRQLDIRQSIALLLVASMCLMLVACNTTQVLNNINTALQNIETLSPLVIALLPGPYAAAAALGIGFLANVSGAWAKISACQSTGGPTAVVAVCITAAGAGVLAGIPQLAGLPAEIAAAIQTVATELETFLGTYGQKAAVALGAKASGKTIQYGTKDLEKLSGFQFRALAQHDKLAAALAGR